MRIVTALLGLALWLAPVARAVAQAELFVGHFPAGAGGKTSTFAGDATGNVAPLRKFPTDGADLATDADSRELYVSGKRDLCLWPQHTDTGSSAAGDLRR